MAGIKHNILELVGETPLLELHRFEEELHFSGRLIAPVTDTQIFDEIVTVTDEDAYAVSRDIARKEGVTVGISAGAAWWTVLELAKRPENSGKTIVTVFPDSGERYLSADLYEGNVQS